MKSLIYGEASGRFIKEVQIGRVLKNDPHQGVHQVNHVSDSQLGGQVDFLVYDFIQAFSNGKPITLGSALASPLFLEIFWRKLSVTQVKGHRVLVLPNAVLLRDDFTATKNNRPVNVVNSRVTFKVNSMLTLAVNLADLCYIFFHTSEIWDGMRVCSVAPRGFEANESLLSYTVQDMDVSVLTLTSAQRAFFIKAIKGGLLKDVPLVYQTLVPSNLVFDKTKSSRR